MDFPVRRRSSTHTDERCGTAPAQQRLLLRQFVRRHRDDEGSRVTEASHGIVATGHKLVHGVVDVVWPTRYRTVGKSDILLYSTIGTCSTYFRTTGIMKISIDYCIAVFARCRSDVMQCLASNPMDGLMARGVITESR